MAAKSQSAIQRDCTCSLTIFLCRCCGVWNSICLQVLFVFETSKEINLVMVASLEFCRSIEGL